jgi:hypothetical protein
MVDKKDDKPGGEDASINDSGELLKSLFRDDLDAMRARKRKETADKTGDKMSAPQKPKSPGSDRAAGREKVAPDIGTEPRMILKNYPVSREQVDKSKKFASDIDTSLDQAVGEKTAPGIKDDTPGESIPEEGIRSNQLEGGEVGLRGNQQLASSKLKVGLLSVLLVAAAAFILGSLGVVDLGQLFGLSEPAHKVERKTGVARRPPAKKTTRVAATSTQKTTDNSAPGQAAVPKRKRIGRMPSEAALSKQRRRIIHRQPRPVAPTQETKAVQEDSTPSASSEKPVIPAQPPKPVASTQKEAVPGQPAEPIMTAQELPMSTRPPEPIDHTEEPLVAKEPAGASAPRAQPVVNEAAPRSAEPTPEEVAPGKEDVLHGEWDLSYPYSIYHGSFKTRKRAERAVSEYRIKGLYPYWVKIDLGDKGVWYRVFSGYFQGREQANEFIKQKQMAESESRHTRYANLIGLFASQEELEEKKVQLSELGYCPYVIPGGGGESALCVGAFYQKARAQRQHTELESNGIRSKIVER